MPSEKFIESAHAELQIIWSVWALLGDFDRALLMVTLLSGMACRLELFDFVADLETLAGMLEIMERESGAGTDE